jgi:hypothetical protein
VAINQVPTTSFSDPFPGRIFYTISVQWNDSVFHDAGFPNSGDAGAYNLSIRGFVSDGVTVYRTPILERKTGGLTAVLQVDYPGASAAWTFGTEVVAEQNVPSGVYTKGFNVTAALEFFKK